MGLELAKAFMVSRYPHLGSHGRFEALQNAALEFSVYQSSVPRLQGSNLIAECIALRTHCDLNKNGVPTGGVLVVPAVFNKAGQHHSEVFVTTASKAGDVTHIADAMAGTRHTTCTRLGYQLVYSKRSPIA